MTKVVLPELGEGIEKATVSYWFFNEGDSVKEGDDLLECATDKATFNIPVPSSGVLRQIVAHEGDTISVGEIIAEIE